MKRVVHDSSALSIFLKLRPEVGRMQMPSGGAHSLLSIVRKGVQFGPLAQLRRSRNTKVCASQILLVISCRAGVCAGSIFSHYRDVTPAVGEVSSSGRAVTAAPPAEADRFPARLT